jgi:hypothetical protein
VIRKLKAAGFIEVRTGKGSHHLFKHPASGKEIWVAVHTKKDAAIGQPHPARGRHHMTRHYPIVFEREDNGAVSAYVPGLPVYAAADTHGDAERAIRHVLAAYLDAHPTARPGARVRVARVSERKVAIVGVAALVGATRSVAKARAARANGRLGGRPRSRVKSKRTKATR